MSNLFTAHKLEKTSKPVFSAYYYRQWNNYEMGFHQHNSIEIMYVINGHCHIELLEANAAAPLLFSLKKGAFIILDGNVPHRLLVKDEGGCRMLNIEFTFQAREQTLPTICELAESSRELAYLLQHIGSYAVLRDVDEVYSTLKSLVLDLDEQTGQEQTKNGNAQSGDEQAGHGQADHAAAGSIKQELLFTQLLLLIAELFKTSVESSAHSTAAQHYVKQVQNYIQQHYDEALSASELAQYVNVHPNYLHRIFRHETGMTIIQYLNQFRLDKARMLLRETDVAITDICEFVGINSRQYFHELFKKYIGLTPVQYREQSNRQKFDNRSKNLS